MLSAKEHRSLLFSWAMVVCFAAMQMNGKKKFLSLAVK